MTTYKGVSTVRDAYLTGAPSIGRISREMGSPSTVAAVLKMHMYDLNKSLKVKQPLTNEDMDFIVDVILSNYTNLSFADIYVIIKNAKMGGYGDLYNTLTAAKVLSWFVEYYSLRCDAAYEVNRQRDAATYGRGVRKDTFRQAMGYSIEDGRTVVDTEVMRAKDEVTAAYTQAMRDRNGRQGDYRHDPEYRRMRDSQRVADIIAKPEEQRTPAERQMLKIYQENNNKNIINN